MKNCCQLGEDRIHLIVLSVSHRGRRHQGRRHQGRIERRKRLDILHILPEVHSGLGLGRTEALCPPIVNVDLELTAGSSSWPGHNTRTRRSHAQDLTNRAQRKTIDVPPQPTALTLA